MNLTKSQLKQVIQEEYANMLNEFIPIPAPRGYGRTGHEIPSPEEMWHGTPASENWDWTNPFRSALEGSIYDRAHNMFPHPEDAKKAEIKRLRAINDIKAAKAYNRRERERVNKLRGEGPYAAATDASGVFAPRAPLGGVYDEEQQMSYPVNEGRAQLTEAQLKQIIDEVYKALLQERDSQEGAPVPKKKLKDKAESAKDAFLHAAGTPKSELAKKKKKRDTLDYLQKRSGRKDIHLSWDDAQKHDD